MKHSVLILEDDVVFGIMLQKWLNRNEFEAFLSTSVKDAQLKLTNEKIDIVLSDLRLPDGDGIMLLQWIHDAKLSVPLIIMTSYGEIQSAVAAIKLGAEDYLEKPVNPSVLKERIQIVLSRKQNQTAPFQPENAPNNIIWGESEASKRMKDFILRVAPTKMSVLILGESGTGKEYAARMIHENSTRKQKTFMAVDCGSLSKELAPSELFGHLKGSFTSAVYNKAGVFEQANGGTVFLDEVGNLSYDVQIQLLRALQEKKVRPVGSSKDVEVDVRIIAATNENLENAIASGHFREDLYYRLNEFSLYIPPLRERKDDVELFATEFLHQANKELERNVKGFTPEVLSILKNQYWNGNLRELRNLIRRVVLFTANDFICKEDVPMLSPFTSFERNGSSFSSDNEQEQIVSALQKTKGNKTAAAKLLNIDRKTLYNKMHQFGIKF